jgi:hypothetical protein
MTVRPLDLLDLPLLPRYRRSIISLDASRALTHGNPLGALAFLSYLNPRRTIYTAVASADGLSLMGQVALKDDEPSARLAFITPQENANGLTLSLMDHLATQAGGWGAFHLLAEVDEDNAVFKSLRQAGFNMYAWQRIWRLPAMKAGGSAWRRVEEVEWPAVQALHGQIVPALIQPVDPLPQQAAGLVCRQDGVLQAYATISSGPSGTWIQPLVPPEIGCSAELLASLPGLGNRPAFICVRSYQAWLETVLEEIGAEAGARQAVMVKRLAKLVKEPASVPMVEKAFAKVKPTASVSRSDGER